MSETTFHKKSDPVKWLERATVVLFCCILAVFIAGFVPVSHPAITRKVVELVRRTGADTCAVGRVRIALWKGISLYDVKFSNKIGQGRNLSVRAKNITLRGNCATAFFKLKKLDPAMLSQAARTQETARAVRQYCAVVAGISQGITLAGADFALLYKGLPVVSGSDLSITLSFPEKNNGDFTGSFSLSLFKGAQTPPFRQLGGEIAYAGSSLSLTQCKGRFCDGKIRCDARMNLACNALASLTFVMNNFDFDEWYRNADSSAGRFSGKADCRLTLDSSALVLDSLRGKGNVSVSRLEIRRFPFQQQLVSMLTYPGLAHLRFRKFKADFTVKPAGLIATDATGDGDTLNVKASGWFRTGGQLDQRLLCTVTKIAVPTLSDFARKTLEETPQGGRLLRLRIFGTVYDPKIVIDSKVILQNAVQNMFEEVKNNLQKWLH